jgi:predicted MarR family transcription regulator
MKTSPPTQLGPVVSSAHLAQGSFPELSELEFGLTISANAFSRWIVRGMAASGTSDLSPLEVLVLHSVHHRERGKTLANICLVLNIEDTHTVNYAVRKLTTSGLVRAGRQGKEKTVEATPAGAAACRAYAEMREHLLLRAIQDLGIEPDQVSRLAALLRLMSGHYDQAARAAAAF